MTELTLKGLEKALSHSLGTHTVGDVRVSVFYINIAAPTS